MSRTDLVTHLRQHALLRGQFTLRSGAISDWYVDARRTTYDGLGARLVGAAVLDELLPEVDSIGGMTMGADPIAVATAVLAAEQGRHLVSFSVRKAAKDHGIGGRLVGPVKAGSLAAVVEDTTTTGRSMLEAVEALREVGVVVSQAITIVDRSGGLAAKRCAEAGISLTSLVTTADLGVVSA